MYEFYGNGTLIEEHHRVSFSEGPLSEVPLRALIF